MVIHWWVRNRVLGHQYVAGALSTLSRALALSFGVLLWILIKLLLTVLAAKVVGLTLVL